jgi:phosphate starvation-inducible protein PhoH and related proteins
VTRRRSTCRVGTIRGCSQVERILRGIDGIEIIYLDEVDVVRHRLVKDIIRAYAAADEERQER